MKAICLFCVLALAKGLILAGREIPFSGWTPVAFFWQDALVALIFAALDRASLRWPWAGWSGYALLAAYTALNVPLARLLSTPMTLTMLRATRGALADSIQHHLTWQNIALLALLGGVAAALPVLMKRSVDTRLKSTLLLAAGLMVALGPAATARVETMGLHRNALVALVESALPRLAAQPFADDWRRSPFMGGAGEDLTRFRGVAAGRNVVLILLESTGANYLRPYGAASDPMPRLTALARESILFENACAVYPESIKGLFSVLCSQYPAIDTPPRKFEQFRGLALPRSLADAGYRTALFHSGRFMYLGMESVIRQRGFGILEDAGDIGGNHNSSFGVDEPAAVGRMLSWLDGLGAGEKFFLTYLPIAGHHPYDAPDSGSFAGNDDRSRYLSALHYGDAALGQFFDGLRARGLFEKTLFIIFGDHGEAFGQHEGNYGHTLFIHEENIRVPYLIAMPGKLPETVRVRRAASLIDTAPTILDLLGLPAGRDFQGESLLELGGRMALFYTDYSLGFLGLRDGPWKFIHELESGRSKLFDLSGDAAERENLAAAHPEKVQFYRAHLRRWSAAQKEKFRSGQRRALFSRAGEPEP